MDRVKKTKLKFKEYFDKAFEEFGLDLICCEDSTNVLTTKKLILMSKFVYSYGIAMLRYNSNNDYVILKNEKAGKEDDYHSIELSKCENFNERYKQINSSEKWNLLRQSYKTKKETV